MKPSTWKISAAALLPSVATMLFIQACGGSGGAQAQSAPDPHVGVWDVLVTQVNCTTNATTAVFRATVLVHPNGTMSGISAGGPTAASPVVGMWSKNADGTYAVRARSHRYNADGTPAGTNNITSTRTQAADNNSFTATTRNEQRDAAGAVQQTLCVTDAATRLF